MGEMKFFASLIVFLAGFGLGCSSAVDPINPFDPQTPADNQAKASLQGSVLGKPVGSAEQTALQGALVELIGPTKPSQNPLVTNADGKFNFGELQPGLYSLDISHAQHFRQVRDVWLEPGDQTELEFILDEIPSGDEQSGHLTGLVYKSGELGQPEELRDHSGIIIEIEGTGVRTVTNTQGRFDLFIQAGNYNVIFSAPNYNLARRNGVEVLAGQTVEIPDSPLVMDPNPGSVSGSIVLEGAAENGHGDVVVSLQGGPTTTSAPNGDFNLTGVAAGTYTLRAALSGYDTHTQLGVNVQGGRETSLGLISMSLSRGTISGSVELVGRWDHSGVTVGLTGTALTTVSNSEGEFILERVKVGTYELSARKDGFLRAVVGGVTVVSQQVTDVGKLLLATQQGDFEINGGAAYTNIPSVALHLESTQAAEMRISEDPSFANSDLGDTSYRSYSATVEFTLSQGDGTKTVFVQYRDTDMVESEVFSSTIVLDTQPPESAAVLIDDGASYTNQPSGLVKLSFVASDATTGVASIQISNDTLFDEPFEPLVASKTHSLSDLDTQGAKTVYVHFRDYAGNQTLVPASDDIIFDTEPPTLTSFSIDFGGVSNAAQCNSPLVELAISANDAYRMALSNHAGLPGAVFEPFSTPRAWFLTAGDETKTVYLKLMDEAGNITDEFTDTIDLDTSPPSTPTLLIENGAEYTNSIGPDHTITLSMSASGATWMRLSTDGVFDTEDWVTYASNTTINLPTGDGLKTVFAVFRDDAYNQTPSISDSIILDTKAPADLSLVINEGAAYTNSEVVTLTLAVDEPYEMVIWTDGTLDSEPWIPFAKQTLATLPPIEGSHAARVRFKDAAGNLSVTDAEDTIILDTTAPTALQILSNSQVVSKTGDLSYTLLTAGPSSETNFSHYERLGGIDNTWTWASSQIDTNSFDFTLQRNDSDEDGVENVLRLRAVDLAGNPGPEASVVITNDTKAPEPVVLNDFWVINGSRIGRVFWQPSSSPDIAGYRILYGTASGVYDGTFASEGLSPLLIGNMRNFALSGLSNGSPTYISVRPVDRAGNLGPAPSSPSEVSLHPNEISTDWIAAETLAMDYPKKVVLNGSYAYFFGFDSEAQGRPCGTVTGDAIFQVVDLTTLVSPVHRGQIQSSALGPMPGLVLNFDDQLSCTPPSNWGPYLDIVIDGMFVYLGSGNHVRVLSTADPTQPKVILDLDVSPLVVHSLAVQGDVLFASGPNGTSNGAVWAIDLDKLFDGNQNTKPSLPTDLIGSADNSSAVVGGISISRNYLIQNGAHSGSVWVYQLDDALDNEGATAFGDTDLTGSDTGFGHHVRSNQPVSGNILYLSGLYNLSLFDLSTMWTDGDLDDPDDLLAEQGCASEGSMNIAGSQAFTTDYVAEGIRSYDINTPTDIVPQGFHSMSGISGPYSSVVYGNYLIVGLQRYSSGQVRVYEIAAPRSLHEVDNTTCSARRAYLSGAFLYGDNGQVIDLQSGSPADVQGVDRCIYSGAVVDDKIVQAIGPQLRIVDSKDGTDRDPSTAFNSSDSYFVDLPEGTIATGVATAGNYLVVIEEKTDGSYLEVFDIRKLRDRQGSLLDMSDSLGAYKFSSDSGYCEVTLHHGRALIVMDGTFNGLFVVDVRPLMDDDQSTNLDADSLQGFYSTYSYQSRYVVGQGNYAYIAARNGLRVVDISEAMDDNPATKISQSSPNGFLAGTYLTGVAVYGSYALVVTGAYSSAGATLDAIDVSDPLNPSLVSSLPIVSSGTFCKPYSSGASVARRAHVVVRGTRAYVTGNRSQLVIVDIE